MKRCDSGSLGCRNQRYLPNWLFGFTFHRQPYPLCRNSIVTPCSDVMGFSVELGRWHNTECLESGTVILECKDGKYEALGEEDIFNS